MSWKGFARSGWVVAVLVAYPLLAMGAAPRVFAAGRVRQVTLVVRDFRFDPATLRLKAGESVALTIKNDGAVEHEWSAGRDVVDARGERGYRTDLWALLKPRVTGRHYAVEKASVRPSQDALWEGETAKMLSTEVDLDPGGSVTLRFRVPAAARGTWEFGCFGLGQYAFGMKGTVIIG